MKKNKQEKIHKTLFGVKHEVKVISPSRINIIGEHIDYLGGNVFPANVSLYMTGLFNKSDDIQIYSKNFKNDGIKIFDDKKIFSFDEKNGFANYVLGCIQILRNKGYQIGGLKMSVSSKIPASSGLSSSAAFGVLVMLGLSKLYNLNLDGKQIAILFKKVENEFMKLKNGIMDQFIIACGEKDKIMLLNTSTLKFKQYSANLGDYKFVIFNTMKPRNLVESKYNERVSETTKALADINRENNFINLCKIPFKDRDKYIDLIQNKTHKKRAKYAIDEQNRVKRFIKELSNQNYVELGKILNEGHAGLRDLYEVSCVESDTIQKYANEVNGVLGARMTGAGFGGCLIVLVDKDSVKELKKKVIKNYEREIGYKCKMYLVDIVNHAE